MYQENWLTTAAWLTTAVWNQETGHTSLSAGELCFPDPRPALRCVGICPPALCFHVARVNELSGRALHCQDPTNPSSPCLICPQPAASRLDWLPRSGQHRARSWLLWTKQVSSPPEKKKKNPFPAGVSLYLQLWVPASSYSKVSSKNRLCQWLQLPHLPSPFKNFFLIYK